MANEEHLSILRNGVGAWNQWHWEHLGTEQDLSGAELRGAQLVWVIFRHARLLSANLDSANLRFADLSCAHLNSSKLRYANLARANLSGANLAFADLSSAFLGGADMRGLNLRSTLLDGAVLVNAKLENAFFGTHSTSMNFAGADLSGVIFGGANLRNTNFSEATVRGTTFSNCDLSEAKGLDRVRHGGPSTVGIDTIYRSRGKIAEGFLRGCGVQEGFITEMHSLVAAVDGIQFYSCFISHSSKDEEFARRLHGRMRDAHLRVWFAPEDMKGSDLLITQIETAIHIYDKLLIVLSETSLQDEWVITELRKARKAERQSGKRKLFPVRLMNLEMLRDWECFDADSGKDLAVELREYFIPDFSNWKDHDQFEAAFTRLLKDLRAEERAA